jgi:transcriptional regulator with XRE-family HTH domain
MHPTAPLLPGPYARLRVERFDKRAAELGLANETQIAERLGLSLATVNRVRAGQVIPGERFIAAAVDALGLPFEQLFEITRAS